MMFTLKYQRSKTVKTIDVQSKPCMILEKQKNVKFKIGKKILPIIGLIYFQRAVWYDGLNMNYCEGSDLSDGDIWGGGRLGILSSWGKQVTGVCCGTLCLVVLSPLPFLFFPLHGYKQVNISVPPYLSARIFSKMSQIRHKIAEGSLP